MGSGPAVSTEIAISEYTIKPLGPDTWDAFAQEGNRALKERLVNEGRAHAALVFDDDVAVAWC
jgi:hypothetical protein